MRPSKVVVVTGAARGIGASTVLELARAGMTPVLFVRSEASAQPVVDALRSAGAASWSLQCCDVSNYDQVATAVAHTLERHRTIDAVVNNAGQIDPIGKLAQTDPAQWKRALEVNLVGAYHVTHAALAAMAAAKKGYILNLSSGAAHTARVGWSAYCSAKAGLLMLTRAVAAEYAEDGIVATGFQPGVVDTDMQARIRSSGINEISKLRREDLAPTQRVARAIAWLCRETPRQFSGEDITIGDLMSVDGASDFIRAPNAAIEGGATTSETS